MFAESPPRQGGTYGIRGQIHTIIITVFGKKSSTFSNFSGAVRRASPPLYYICGARRVMKPLKIKGFRAFWKGRSRADLSTCLQNVYILRWQFGIKAPPKSPQIGALCTKRAFGALVGATQYSVEADVLDGPQSATRQGTTHKPVGATIGRPRVVCTK